MTANSRSSAEDAAVRNQPDLGVLRTMMAADRTLMAWVRTALSMVGFGYTIYKVLQEVREIGKIALHDTAPRNAGVMLTVLGTAALVMGTLEYWVTLQMLRRSYDFRIARPALIMALVMATAGLFVCFGIGFRMV